MKLSIVYDNIYIYVPYYSSDFLRSTQEFEKNLPQRLDVY